MNNINLISKEGGGVLLLNGGEIDENDENQAKAETD
jgi:hypothetical protein